LLIRFATLDWLSLRGFIPTIQGLEMKNPNSPFRVMLRVSGYCALLSMAISAYLFTTSTNNTQYLLSAVILVLLLMLSIAIGFYVALRVWTAREARRNTNIQQNIHYPARDLFERRMAAVEGRVSRMYNQKGRYV
jgi:apolipoprotein N-acyltransferase